MMLEFPYFPRYRDMSRDYSNSRYEVELYIYLYHIPIYLPNI